jgi:hypothetical protein
VPKPGFSCIPLNNAAVNRDDWVRLARDTPNLVCKYLVEQANARRLGKPKMYRIGGLFWKTWPFARRVSLFVPLFYSGRPGIDLDRLHDFANVEL